MTAGVCVPQRESECVSCVREVNECYCVRGETPPPSTEVVTIPMAAAATSADLKRPFQRFNVSTFNV